MRVPLDLKPGRVEPCNATCGELRRASTPAAAEQSRRRASAAAPTRRTPLDRQILDQRARLDLSPSHPEPLDRDPTAHIRRYRFGLAYFLKSPRFSTDLTRGPNQCESNSILVLKLYTLAPDLLQF